MVATFNRKRPGDRAADALRPVSIQPNYAPYAEGSVLIAMGNTHVLCTATVETRVPPFLVGTGKGWVTAEYGMLPRSSPQRIPRDRVLAAGRTHEIQRLIGRSLRAVTDLKALGERSIVLDCDVLRADGGTRTAAVTGAYVALRLALERMVRTGQLKSVPLGAAVAAVSVGVVYGETRLDLEYEEDSHAEVDCNVVMTNRGAYVEVQGTAEEKPFDRARLDDMLALAERGIRELFQLQAQALEAAKASR
ncbi:MAG TPA: ribonuclease PH [Thermomicrobiaceae bacterium]|nr:ribonuclease PH [Thermomicrobiaceae bacterium]